MSDVIWVLVPCDTEGDEVTVHVTRIRPYYGPRETGRAIFPGVKDIEDLGDELAEELTSPVVWTQPLDEFHNVPVKWGIPEALIKDIPRKKQTKDASQQSEPAAGGGNGQRLAGTRQKVRVQVPQPAHKRDRSSDSSDTDGPARNRQRPGQGEKRAADPIAGPSDKKFIQRNEKRPQESDPEKQSSLWTKISKLLLSSEDSSMEGESPSQQSSDDGLEAIMGTDETMEAPDLQIRSAQRTTIPAYGMGQVKLKTEKVPKDCLLMVVSRPALARKGILVDTMTIRNGFEGEMTAIVRNEGSQEVRIEKGQRLAQSVLMPICDPSTVAGRVASAREQD